MFVIKNKESNGFIDIDKTSSGYPYETHLQLSYKWPTIDAAKKYLDLFISSYPNWVIEEVIMETRPIS